MKQTFLTIFTLLFLFSLAQNGTIKGTILDQKNNNPISFATISVSDGTKVIDGAIANEAGNFKIIKLPFKNLKVSIQFLGYTTIEKSINLSAENPTFDFGNVALIEDVTQLNEVVLEKRKKAVEQKADRTIFDFSQQAYLNSGTVLEGLKKLPGLIISDVAGLMYQGKQLEVFLNSRPLNISSDELNSFLEGLPANSIEKVEIITQPGAEFPATSGGAIINIITNKSINKYLSATYSTGYNFTNYDQIRSRSNNSLLISAKNKYFGWQLNIGNNYRESNVISEFSKTENNTKTILSANDSDRMNRSYFAKSGITFDFKKDRLLLNYDVNFFNNDANILSNGIGFNSNDRSKTKTFRYEAAVAYQKRFEDVSKKLDFNVSYTENNNNFNLNSNLINFNLLDNQSNQGYFNAKIDYSQELKILEKGKLSFGTLYDVLSFETNSFNVLNLDYQRKTAAAYLELQSTYQKFDFIVGGRLEDYDITGKTETSNIIPFKQTQFFPNASIQYNFAPQLYFNMNYNKKIDLPSTSALNPNNTNFQNPNLVTLGNPQLQPTFFNNFEAKISAFDYAYISYSVSQATNEVVTRITENNNQISNLQVNLDEVKIHNFSFGIPIPFMLFTTSLSELMKFDFNPDKINFMYLYSGYQKHQLQNLDTKGFWMFNLMAQIILPKDIKFVTNYNYNTTGGNYYYFIAEKPFNHSLDFSFSKKFLNDQLAASIFIDDAFNLNNQAFGSVGTPLLITNKYDTRRIGFTLSYKLPTKNKLAKEDQNILNKDKKEDSQLISN